MATTPPKTTHKPDFSNPQRKNDFEALARAKELTRDHRYAIRIEINGVQAWKLLTKQQYKRHQIKINKAQQRQQTPLF